MKSYISTREVLAEPMTRREYCTLRNWGVPENEDPNTQGYLINFNKPEENDNPDFTWCPKVSFEKHYKPFDKMSFGTALELLKKDKKVRRLGWLWPDYVYVNVVYTGVYHNEKAEREIQLAQAIENNMYNLCINNTLTPDTVDTYYPKAPDLFATDWVEVV